MFLLTILFFFITTLLGEIIGDVLEALLMRLLLLNVLETSLIYVSMFFYSEP